MKNPSIVSVGEVLWDLMPDEERFGGAPANFACRAALGGANVTMLSCVGDDERGRLARKILEEYGIDVSLLSVADVPTGSVGVELDSEGKPTFTIQENAAWDHLHWSAQVEKSVRSADALYFGTLGQRSTTSRQTIRRCADTAKANGVPRIVDINLRAPFFDDQLIRETIELASVLKLSQEELGQVAAAFEITCNEDEQILRELLRKVPLEVVALTRGAAGAVLVSSEDTVDQPGIPAIVRDTVGAGDAFMATFALGLLRDQSFELLLQNACTAASEVCAISGAIPDVSDKNFRRPTR